MRIDRTAVTGTFYAALVVAVAGVLFEVFPRLLPEALAVRIGHNSEGLVLALVLALWIEFARPRLAQSRREWPLTALAAAGYCAVGLFLLDSDLPSRFRTLNETFLAAALLVPYLQLRRPLPRRLAVSAAGAVLLVIVVFNRTAVVTNLAETLGVLLLAPLAFDVVDRGILDAGARTSPRRRRGWYALLVAVPVILSLLEYRIGVHGGVVGEAVRYGVRITEAFACLLLVQLYFAVALGRTGRATSVATPALTGSIR
jgi:hypothetical protein